MVWIRSSNRLFVGLILPEILRCIYFGVLDWNCLFTPLFGEFLGHIFPHDVTHRPDPQKDLSWAKHVVRAIQRKNQCDGSTWARDRENNAGQQKSHKSVIFPYLGGKPHWTDSTQELHGGWCPRRNHVCDVSNWNLYGLRFYIGSNFRFSYWFLHGAYNNSAALIRCLWLALVMEMGRKHRLEQVWACIYGNDLHGSWKPSTPARRSNTWNVMTERRVNQPGKRSSWVVTVLTLKVWNW